MGPVGLSAAHASSALPTCACVDLCCPTGDDDYYDYDDPPQKVATERTEKLYIDVSCGLGLGLGLGVRSACSGVKAWAWARLTLGIRLGLGLGLRLVQAQMPHDKG